MTAALTPTAPSSSAPDLALASDPVLPSGDAGSLVGPWSSGFWFCLRRQVVSKSNHRRGGRSTAGAAWQQVAGFELEVRSAARRYRPTDWLESDPSAAVARRPQLLVCAFARTLLDVGNVDKSLLDGMEGPLMVSDAQVRWSLSGSVRVSGDPGVLVAVVQLPAGSSFSKQAAASACLICQVATLLTGPPAVAADGPA